MQGNSQEKNGWDKFSDEFLVVMKNSNQLARRPVEKTGGLMSKVLRPDRRGQTRAQVIRINGNEG
jgi:hypothetical protein